MNGIDISWWQNGINLNNVPCDFVISKISGGMSNKSADFDRQWKQAKGANKLRGAYHFAKDGGPVNSAVAEADNFIKHVKPYLDGETILVLDFEADAVPLGAGWAKQWLDRVFTITGIRPLIYLSGSLAAQSQWDIVVKANYGLWVANWGKNAASGYINPPKVSSGRWGFSAIHQYTSNGSLPGYAGRLDLNKFFGDKAAWLKYAKDTRIVDPIPDPTPDPEPDPTPDPEPDPTPDPEPNPIPEKPEVEVPNNTPTETPNVVIENPNTRKIIYNVIGWIGLVLLCTSTGFTFAISAKAVDGFPLWLGIANAVYPVLGIGIGYTASKNTPK